MSEQFGVTSDEARKAAKRVAELEDALGDAKQLSDAFNPDKKFAALSQSLQGVLGGFTALTGAMSLLGVESEDVQKQLLKVQGALALGQGVDQVRESINSFKTLGKTLVDTLGKNGLLGLAIAGVAALGAALLGVFDGAKKLTEAQKLYNDTLKDFAKAAGAARQQVAEVQSAFNLFYKGLTTKDEALKKYNDTLGDSFGRTNDLRVAEKNLTDKAGNYIKITGLKAQANALFAISAQKVAEAEVKYIEAREAGKFSPRAEAGKFGSQAELDRYNTYVRLKEDAEALGKELDAKAGGLLGQVKELEKTTGIKTSGGGRATGGGGKISTPRTEQAKAEEEEIEMIAAQSGERILEKRQLLDQYFLNNKKLFVEEGKRLEQEEFDEKIALLNLELDVEENATRRRIELAEMEKQARVQAAQDIGGALGALSDLIGRQTAAGKVLAIAQAGINMWLGVTEVLRTKSTLPEPIATISRIANITTVIATGLSAIKNIAKQNVGGGSGGGGGVGVTAPLQPQIQSTNTTLNQNQLNQIGNATTRAFVLETDITNNQERVRRLNRAARLG
jgi:hypothetical protein